MLIIAGQCLLDKIEARFFPSRTVFFLFKD
jgi:hypothetical protein